MSLRNITLAFLGITWLFSACNSDTEYDLSGASADAQISSFSLTGVHDKTWTDSVDRATDSLRYVILGKTKFAIDQVNDLIYNPDSLPYGFTLKTLLPAITYVGSPSSLTIELKDALKSGVADTTYQWNGSDSINLAYKRISVNVVAANQATSKSYKLDIRIHKVDPDSIKWKIAAKYSSYASYRKSVLSGDSINTLTKTLTSSLLLEVVKGISNSSSSVSIESKNVSGLPSDVKVLSFGRYGDSFYVLSDDGKTFKSSNAQSWAEVNNGVTISEILGVAPGNYDSENRIIVLVKDGADLRFGATLDFSSVVLLDQSVPSGFPVKGFASVANVDGLKSRRMLFVGTGKDKNDNDLSSIWLLKMNGDLLSVAKAGASTYFSGAGNSLFQYDDKVYLLSKRKLYVSTSWGLTWVEADGKQALPSIVKNYTEQTVVVKNNGLWILGGKDSGGDSAAEIWTGVLNRLK